MARDYLTGRDRQRITEYLSSVDGARLDHLKSFLEFLAGLGTLDGELQKLISEYGPTRLNGELRRLITYEEKTRAGDPGPNS